MAPGESDSEMTSAEVRWQVEVLRLAARCWLAGVRQGSQGRRRVAHGLGGCVCARVYARAPREAAGPTLTGAIV
eukprot:scaffold34114_cov41-Tisochrysis_lutea.AAC.6